MRQTCPNCGAEYDVPEGMVPGAGRHVQCSACHTRWFVRGSARPAASEEQILARLENWQPRPRPVIVPVPADATATTPPAARPRPVEPLRVVSPAAVSEEIPEETDAGGVLTLDRTLRDPATRPAERPTLAQPSPVGGGPVRPAPRLDLDQPRPAPAPPAPPESRFVRGFLFVVIPALIAFGVYRFADPLAAAVPAAEPALDAYAATIDGWRAAIEQRIDAVGTTDG